MQAKLPLVPYVLVAARVDSRNLTMTEAEYRVRRTRINEQVEAKQERVDAYRDQELAKLFYDSGWLQKELAA